MNRLRKPVIPLVALVIGMLFAGSVPAYAANCQQRIRKAQMHLQKAVRRHGPNSIQAQRRREELERVRANCHR